MSKKNKIATELIFDSAEMQGSMMMFFDTYKEQLPPFLKDAMSKFGIKSDPSMVLYPDKSRIMFKKVNTDKGACFVYSDKKQKALKTVDYKLVPNDSAYIKLETNQLVIFWKNADDADDTIAVFPSVEMAIAGLKDVESPKLIQERIDEIDARDADRNEEVMAEVAEVIKERDGGDVEMKVEK